MACLLLHWTVRIKWWKKNKVDIPDPVELGFSWGHLSNHHTHSCKTAPVTGTPNGKWGEGGWNQVEDRNMT